MNIMILTQKQNPFGKTILYTPDLETEHNKIVAKVYPAVYEHNGDVEYFMISDEEIGKYNEQMRSPERAAYYECLGGKAEIEKQFKKLYNTYTEKAN